MSMEARRERRCLIFTKRNETQSNERIRFASSKFCAIPNFTTKACRHHAEEKVRTLLLLLTISSCLLAQDRQVDPTWLHRYVPSLNEKTTGITSASCRYKPIFGEGDADNRSLRSVTRFGEVSLGAGGNCESTVYDREEEIFFVTEGKIVLQYGDEKREMRANDFTYVPPGMRHAIANHSS